MKRTAAARDVLVNSIARTLANEAIERGHARTRELFLLAIQEIVDDGWQAGVYERTVAPTPLGFRRFAGEVAAAYNQHLAELRQQRRAQQ